MTPKLTERTKFLKLTDKYQLEITQGFMNQPKFLVRLEDYSGNILLVKEFDKTSEIREYMRSLGESVLPSLKETVITLGHVMIRLYEEKMKLVLAEEKELEELFA